MKLSSPNTLKTFRTYASIAATLGFGALAGTGMTACSKLSEAYTSTYQLPWADSDGNYSLQNVQINSFNDPKGLQGQYGQVLVHPHDDANGKLADTKASGRFVRAGGVEVAVDVLSLQAATIYAHLERFHQLDTWTGGVGAITWPLTVGLEVNTTDGTVNNALYDGRRNAVIVVPYKDDRLPISINGGILAHEHFHVIFQALVISHLPDQGDLSPRGLKPSVPAQALTKVDGEWDPATITAIGKVASASAASDISSDGNLSGSATPSASPSPSASAGPFSADGQPRLPSEFAVVPVTTYNEFLIRGINEGLADFYAWVYSGDPTFIENSLSPDDVSFRRMDVSAQELPSAARWVSLLRVPGNAKKLVSANTRLAEAYYLGTFYSRFLRELTIRLNTPAIPVSSGVALSEVITKAKVPGTEDAPLSSPRNAKALAGVSDQQIKIRSGVANALIAALPEMLVMLRDQYQNQYIEPTVFLRALFAHLPAVNAAACDLVESFGNLQKPEAGTEKVTTAPGAETQPADSPASDLVSDLARARSAGLMTSSASQLPDRCVQLRANTVNP